MRGHEEQLDKDVANLPSMVTDYVVKRVVVWELGTRDKDEEERRQIRTGRCDGRTEHELVVSRSVYVADDRKSLGGRRWWLG